MAKASTLGTFGSGRTVNHKKRHGVHSKCKTSKLKASKHYVKKYRGQGR